MGRVPVRVALAAARSRLQRLTPHDAAAAQAAGALLVDVRTGEQRDRDGAVPGALTIPLNVLEWRLDPDEPAALAEAGNFGRQVVVLCQEGFCSSLAAARLLDLGYERATDVIGGFTAWRDAGLPIDPPTSSGFPAR